MKSKYFYYLILGHIFISTIVYYPNIQSKNIYNGFILAIVLGYFIAMWNSYCLIETYNIFNQKDLIYITNQLFKKTFGKIVVFLFVMISAITGLFMHMPLIKIVQSNMMPETSATYIAMFAVLIYIVALKNKEKSILYPLGFFSIFCGIGFLLIFSIITKGVDTRFIIGSITHSFRLPYISMIASTTYFFNGIETLAVYNVALGKKSFKTAYLIYGLIGIPLSFIPILIPIGAWGPYAVKDLVFPVLATSDTVALDLFLVERVLFVFLPISVCIQILGAVSYFYVAYKLVEKSISSKLIKKLIYIVFSLILLLLPKFIGDFQIVGFLARIWGYIWFSIICILCPILYIKSKKWRKALK